MPKRSYPDDDEIHPIKKQQISKLKYRKIHSSSSERTMQLLYKGALKLMNTESKLKVSKMLCGCPPLFLPPKVACNFCERDICTQCTNICHKCNHGFCTSCSFLTYDQNEAVCYSCYS